MRKIWEAIKEKFYKLHLNISVAIVYTVTITIVAIAFYPLIPLILNFPPGAVNTDFQIKIQYTNYFQQYIIITLFVLIMGILFFKYKLKYINEWSSLVECNDVENIEKLKYIRRKCLNLPYSIYIIQIIVPSVIVFIFHSIIDRSIGVTSVKIITLIFSFITLAAVVTHIFSKKIYTQILFKTYKEYEDKEIKRISLRKKIFLQVLPIFIVAVLFTSLIGYSRLTKEKGDLLFDSYNQQLISKFANINKIKDVSDIQKVLNTVKLKNPRDCTFIISPANKISTSNGSILNDFFLSYLRELSPKYDGRVYDAYASDIQGATKIVSDQSNSYWIIGVQYVVNSNETITFFFVSFIILLGLNGLILSYFSKTLSEDIAMVSKSLNKIGSGGDIDHMKKIPVTSNDEIGDLVVAFNKIQDLTRENIEQIKQTQQQLAERERLASLGGLIGGIAHDINSPLASLQCHAKEVRNLTREYEEGISDSEVTPEDHRQIANEIKDNLDKIDKITNKIAGIVNSVRNHTRNLDGDNFGLIELRLIMEDIQILLGHELKHNKCQLIYKEDRTIYLIGDQGKLSQVLTNLVANAIQAYNRQPGIVEVNARSTDKEVIISVTDKGQGIDPKIRAGIFKEVLTTKGTKGTGLGLYISYSVITGHFRGKMWFDSEIGEGTTFNISLPKDIKPKEKIS